MGEDMRRLFLLLAVACQLAIGQENYEDIQTQFSIIQEQLVNDEELDLDKYRDKKANSDLNEFVAETIEIRSSVSRKKRREVLRILKSNSFKREAYEILVKNKGLDKDFVSKKIAESKSLKRLFSTAPVFLFCESDDGIPDFHLLLFGNTECIGETSYGQERLFGPGLWFQYAKHMYVCARPEGDFRGYGVGVDLGAIIGGGVAAFIGNGFCLRFTGGGSLGFRFGLGIFDLS